MSEKKTIAVNMKLSPTDKQLLEKIAAATSRNLSNTMTFLIREEAKRLGITIDDH